MTASEQALAVRAGAGLFSMSDRGAIRVSGGDRSRWLGGMISNDVSGLTPGPSGSGCYALVLTPKGGIVADVHVLLREDGLWLETARTAVPGLIDRLGRYVIADDVELEDVSDRFDRIALEGPAAGRVLAAAAGSAPEIDPECCADLEVAGFPLVAAAFGWSGEAAYQLFAARGAGVAVAAALRSAAGADLVPCERQALEILRVEAGIPALGPELDEDVFPGEARLERAVSDTKGCYIGQEIVARIRSRGRVRHLLVGLHFEAETSPEPGVELKAAGRRTGEVTSACVSGRDAAIGLGFVRREHAEPGTALDAGGVPAHIRALPPRP